MIPVTKSFLPPISEYMSHVQRAYANEWLTNRGELVQELEQKLTDYLHLLESKILCMNNGTIPLQIAIKLLGGGGEIITTPFSYVATTSAIVWEHCTPVFVDIHPEYLTIDETKIEAAITDKTSCILATHVFGNPCHVEEIDRIAKKYSLKVIYDAAHCFGVKYKGKSIFEYGDVSTCSFHATKLFHTGEGGAIFCKDPELFHRIYYSHNFGHDGPLDFHGLGINGKISELQAAMGLAILPHMEEIIQGRKKAVEHYNDYLKKNTQCQTDHQKIIETVPYSVVVKNKKKETKNLKIRQGTVWNYSYYPLLFENEEALLEVQKKLNQMNVFPRRYFYPSLNTLPYVKQNNLEIAQRVSETILCLPLFLGLKQEDISRVVDVINRL